MRHDLRELTATALRSRRETIAADAALLFPYANDTLDAPYCRRLADRIVALLATVVSDDRADAPDNPIAQLHQLARERSVSMRELFAFVYHVERTALDELSIDETIGATTEEWPVVAQLLRRASFDLLAEYAERVRLEPTEAAVTDPLTTLHTRPLFDAVLGKEVERAARAGSPISFLLVGVDGLAAIADAHGAGVGDRILERLGILVRQYFRHHDWVARHGADSIAILLTRTDVAHAGELAERLRATVEERLGFTDYRSDETVPVTISVAVVCVQTDHRSPIDPDRLTAEAESLLARLRHDGRNRIDSLDVSPPSHTPPRSSPSA